MCSGTDLVVPSSTEEVAQAISHYYKLAQVIMAATCMLKHLHQH
jgi:uncharacterized protein YlzI (FlbEa/FlbD family)